MFWAVCAGTACLAFCTHPFSPQISMALQATRDTELQFAAGKYQQFSNVSVGPPTRAMYR